MLTSPMNASLYKQSLFAADRVDRGSSATSIGKSGGILVQTVIDTEVRTIVFTWADLLPLIDIGSASLPDFSEITGPPPDLTPSGTAMSSTKSLRRTAPS